MVHLFQQLQHYLLDNVLRIFKTSIRKGLRVNGKFAPVHVMKTLGCGGVTPFVLNFDSRWKQMVRFAPPAALPLGVHPPPRVALE